jgi:hypothetical protein
MDKCWGQTGRLRPVRSRDKAGTASAMRREACCSAATLSDGSTEREGVARAPAISLYSVQALYSFPQIELFVIKFHLLDEQWSSSTMAAGQGCPK